VGGLTEVIVLSPADVDRLIAQGESKTDRRSLIL
jgi:hypothetical protein